MAYDISSTATGVTRYLGTATQARLRQYNASLNRWERVIPSTATGVYASIQLSYDKNAGTNPTALNGYRSNQPIFATVTWNRPVTGFSTASMAFIGTGTWTVSNNTVTQVTSSKYTFCFNFTGEIGQFVISSSTVTATDVSPAANANIYSPGFPGINTNRGYAVLDFYTYTNPHWIVSDPYFPGVNRYVVIASFQQTMELRITFMNFLTNVPNSGSGAFSYQSITSAGLSGESDTLNYFSWPIAANPNNVGTPTGGTNPRYSFYTTNYSSTNNIYRTYVARNRYWDGNGYVNEEGPPFWVSNIQFGLGTPTILLITSGGVVTQIAVIFSNYPLALLQSLPSTTTNVTLSGGGTLSNIAVDTSEPYGHQLIMDYTSANTTTDYTETVTFAPMFAVFKGNGANVTLSYNAGSYPFTTSTHSLASQSFSVIKSPLVFQYFSPAASTVVSSGTFVFGANRTITSNGGRYRLWNNQVGGVLMVSGVVPSPVGSNVTLTFNTISLSSTYTIEIDAGAFKDSFGFVTPAVVYNFFSTSTEPRGNTVITSSQSFTVPAFISKISVVAVSRGGAASCGSSGAYGGTLAWKNNISVSPGQVLQAAVGCNISYLYRNDNGGSYIIQANTGSAPVDLAVCGGNGAFGGARGGAGGTGNCYPSAGGGGGAGGYNGVGGAGGTNSASSSPGTGGGGGGGGSYSGISFQQGGAGGGVGLYGLGGNGAGVATATATCGSTGLPGSGGDGSTYGGGSGGNTYSNAGGGAIRIIWGSGRAFPNQCVSTQTQ
jgi:hypothetical protein